MNSFPVHELARLEKLRDSTVMVYCHGEQGKWLDARDVPIFYQCLRKLGRTKRLDVILNIDGGLVSIAQRVARLLRKYTDHLSILVPYKARSAGTLLCLGADEIILGPLGELSPLDPMIRETAGGLGKPQISAEDIRGFRALMEGWFGLQTEEHRMQAFSLLAQHIFPTTLSMFFRADQYVRKVGQELLQYHLPQATPGEREQVMDRLICSYPEHTHCFTCEDLQQMGLHPRPASDDEETSMWNVLQWSLSYLKGKRSVADNLITKGQAVLFSRNFAAHNFTDVPTTPGPLIGGEPPVMRPSIAMGGWEIIDPTRP